jgi:hypothetical protein
MIQQWIFAFVILKTSANPCELVFYEFWMGIFPISRSTLALDYSAFARLHRR